MSTNSALIVPPPGQTTTVEAGDIRAPKGPVDVPWEWTTYLWIAIGVLGVVALLISTRFLRKLRQRVFVKPAPRPMPPHVRARLRLQAALGHISDARLFCFEVSETLRVYLEERFKLRAPERTTEEFLFELQSSHALDPRQKESLAQFLQSCDLVKFARFEPTESALRELHDSALRLVDETQFEPIARADSNQPALALK